MFMSTLTGVIKFFVHLVVFCVSGSTLCHLLGISRECAPLVLARFAELSTSPSDPKFSSRHFCLSTLSLSEIVIPPQRFGLEDLNVCSIWMWLYIKSA